MRRKTALPNTWRVVQLSQREQKAPVCTADEHGDVPRTRFTEAELTRAVRLFRALSDVARVQTLELLQPGERCVSEIASAMGEDMSTVSHRLRLLQSEYLVASRREGRHVLYRLADDHVIELVRNALEHVTHDNNANAGEKA